MSHLLLVQIQITVCLNPGTNPLDLTALTQNLVTPSYPGSTHWLTAEHGHIQIQPQLIQNLAQEEAEGH